MNIKLASMTDKLMGQPMFNLMARANELERQGKDIIHFEIGDPDFNSPAEAIDAVSQAIIDGKTHYTNSMGLLEFRQAVRKMIKRDHDFHPDIEQILIAPANAVIDFLIRCVADPGDEIIIPDPGFPTYLAAASYSGIRPIGVPLREENAFRMNPDDVAKAITPRTRLIIVNSPNNPTGAVMTKDEMMQISKIADKHGVFLLSDEVYSKIVYSKTHHSPSLFDSCKERTIILQSMSKMYSMSGWRLGYTVGPARLINKMGLLLQTIMSCLPGFTQYGAIAALSKCDRLVVERRDILKERRDILVDGLNSLPEVSCLVPEGAFYAFANIKETGLTDQEFSKNMLEEGVCVLPGCYFGERGKNYVRLSYASVSIADIGKAIERMGNVLKRRKI